MGEHEHAVDATVGTGALHQVVEGVFAWVQPQGSWWVNSAGALAGAGRTIVIDTCATAARTQRSLDAVRAATGDAPIRFAANAHELASAAEGRRDGLDPLPAAQRADLGEFASWLDAERLLLNLHRASADDGVRPFDVGAAFGDALTWNGGPLTTHVCCGS